MDDEGDHPGVRVLADRLARLDLTQPRHDEAVIEQAMRVRLDAFGFPDHPIVWAANPQEGRDRLVHQASVDHWDSHVVTRRTGPIAIDSFRFADFPGTEGAERCTRILATVARLSALPVHRNEWDGPTATAARDILWAFSDVVVGARAMDSPSGLVSLSMFRAAEAGLLLYWVTAKEAICVLRPAISLRNGRVHCAAGPALLWPDGYAIHCWSGARVPGWVVEQPDRISVATIRDEPNQEIRRAMLEIYGLPRYFREAGATLLHEDECGRLWEARFGDQAWRFVEVQDGTPGPDGTRRTYTLEVTGAARRLGWPVETARGAVAATYGLREEEYHPQQRT